MGYIYQKSTGHRLFVKFKELKGHTFVLFKTLKVKFKKTISFVFSVLYDTLYDTLFVDFIQQIGFFRHSASL